MSQIINNYSLLLTHRIRDFWLFISHVGVDVNSHDYRQSRQITLANQVSLLGTIVPQLYNVFYVLYDFERLKPVILVNIIGSSVNFSVMLLNHFGRTYSGKLIIAISPNVQIFFLTYFMSTASGMHLLHIMMISFIFFLFSNETKTLLIGMILFSLSLYVFEYVYFTPDFSPIILDVITLIVFYITISLTVFLLVMLFFALFYKEIQYAELQLENEHRRSESLLLNILPEEIAAKLKDNPSFTAEEFDRVTILFADIVGFTEIANKVDSTTLVNRLNEIFSMFDSLAEKHGLEKIKTIGDAYMVAGGVPKPMSNHTEAVARMALDMIESTSHHYILDQQLSVRIGFHTGSVIAGVIGTKKFSYDIWGDAVNTASRLESHGEPGKIHVSDEVYEILKDKFEFKSRGEISIKGLGMMKTYYLTGIK